MTMQDSEYTYYAFVSHSHRDAKWAEWIWSALEHYRLPSNVRKAVPRPLPKRVQPVFIDKADLGSGRLIDGLYRELKASRYLIVVCSPESAKPNAEGKHFVETEVRHFVELGRADRIIPVIVAGTPEMAFCPALKELGLLAIDATKFPRRRVLNDVVAKILGLRPDELWRREERRHRLLLFRRSVLGFVAALALAICGLFVWDDRRAVERDYADYVESYGLPSGLFPLTGEEVAHRSVHYRFVYQGLKFWPNWVNRDDFADNPFKLFGFTRVLRRVEQANSAGRPIVVDDTELGARPPVQLFDEYGSDGTLRQVRHMTCAGGGVDERQVKRLVFSDMDGVVNAVIEFKGENLLELAFARSTDPGGQDEAAKANVSEVAKHVVSRDGAGRVTTVLFYNVYGTKICDSEGVGGHRFERDEWGRIVRRTYLDLSGRECALRNGVAARTYAYAGASLSTTVSMGMDGKPLRNPYGWARCEERFDRFGNVVDSRYYDEQGKPTLDEIGIAGMRCTYDARGFRIAVSYFGLDDSPCVRAAGDAGWRAEYDALGFETRKVSVGVDGKPCRVKAGYAECRCTYDERGNPTSLRYYDADGRPCRRIDGSAGWRAEYDECGREVRNVWLGTDGNPSANEDGYAEYRCAYDSHGRKTSHRFYGTDGSPCFSVNGVAGWIAEYDVKQRATRNAWVGVDGAPCLCKDGYAEWRRSYDTCGNQVSQRYYDAKGKRCLHKSGNSGWLAEYDEKGQKTRIVWIGVDDMPRLLEGGCAECRLTYDARGNKTSMRYYGADGKPCLTKSGWAEIRCAYDDSGRLIECSAFDLEGKRTGHK